MFATLLGALPTPDGREPTSAGSRVALLRDAIRDAIRAQEAAGLEPITDGRLGDPQFEAVEGRLLGAGGPGGSSVERWRLAAGMTERAVKQALPGPYSIGWRGPAPARRAGAAQRAAATRRAAAALREEVEELARAGCPLVEIEESEAHRIGADEAERALFAEAHRALTRGIAGTHLSLSIVGGAAWGAGLETILAAPYASLAVDVIAGPDDWNLVTRLPGDRGVIVGALPARDSPADAREMLLWAARHAAASRGRGLERVGLGSSGSWANLTWEAAVAKMTRLGDAARLAAQPAGENLARALDPRAVNARSAALGAVGPSRRRRPPAG